MVFNSSIQRIGRLTPLGDVLALVERCVTAVAPRRCGIAAALGATLAEDVVAPLLPAEALALRDGFAVAAAAIADAGPYMPVPLRPVPLRVDAGERLPPGTDAVASLDAVQVEGDRAAAMAPVSPADGVLPRGGDAVPLRPLRRAGERVRAVDIGVFAAAGIAEVTIRAPRIRIGMGAAITTPVLDGAVKVLSEAIRNSGGQLLDGAVPLAAALSDAGADAVIAIGGTGNGRSDNSVRELARLGRLEVHGIALSPGETAAFGFAGNRPVLLLPGRLDAVLAVWLLLGRHMVARLAGGAIADVPAHLPLRRKIASPIGLTELIPVAYVDGMAEPLGGGYLSFEMLTRSDGWTVIPPDSEGFQAGIHVAVRPWP